MCFMMGDNWALICGGIHFTHYVSALLELDSCRRAPPVRYLAI